MPPAPDARASSSSDDGQEAYDRLVGRSIDNRYLVESMLGQGGMGAVFRAEQVAIGRPVALKVLHPGLAISQAFHDRFRREAEMASRLRHPHIVTIFDFGRTDDGICYYVMEMLEGQSLHDLVKSEGPLPIGRALRISEQIGSALTAAHAARTIHRDLKPDNVFVTQVDGKDFVKVLDFGLVKLASGDDEDNKLTRTGQIVGTPQYMSPEQAAGDNVDARTDLYALGGCLYFMLAGAPPFRAPTSQKVIGMVLTQKPPRVDVTRIGAPIPEAMQEAIDRILAKEREERPESAEALLVELRASVEGLQAELWEKPQGRREPGAPTPTSASGQRRREAAQGAPSPSVVRSRDEAARARPPAASAARPSSRVAGAAPRASQARAPTPPPAPPQAKGKAIVIGAAIGLGATAALGLGLLLAKPWEEPPPLIEPATPVRPPEPPKVVVEPVKAVDPAKPARPEVVEVRIRSTPPGATIRDGDAVLGVTPAELKVQRSRAAVNYTIELAGHAPRTQGVDLSAGDDGKPISLELELVPVVKSAPAKAKPTKQKEEEEEVPIF